jgi:streptomycin 6-kinase
VRLLHGDLHHDNVILDDDRGWLAVDPKGVIAEPEYEVGAALRNPFDRPVLFADPATIRKRVDRFARDLALDATRVLSWAFAQAVLSAVWTVEDGLEITPDHNGIALATAIASEIW